MHNIPIPYSSITHDTRAFLFTPNMENKGDIDVSLFGKSARTGNEIDMYVGQIKAKVSTAKMTLKQSDMIEMQFAQLADMAKRSGDAQLVMQFEMLKSLMDNMQNNTVMILNDIEQDLQKIDNATDKIQNGIM